MASEDPKALSKFSATSSGDGYRLHIEDEAGETLELTATYDQLEILADTLDELLGADDSAAEVQDDDAA